MSAGIFMGRNLLLKTWQTDQDRWVEMHRSLESPGRTRLRADWIKP